MNDSNDSIETKDALYTCIKKLPSKPGVYLFKDAADQILYIGKAKNLKKRVSSYIQKQNSDLKSHTIIEASDTLDFIEAQSELEAMILEAKLIRSNQPPLNVLLKFGQPFLYIMITGSKTPDIKIVRNQKLKGSYFGPFIEKSSARKVYDFLMKTFRLKRCGKKIANGCLFYHMGICSGSCRPDFDLEAYCERMELARTALKQGHAKFLVSLKKQIEEHNKKHEFEKSKELYGYYQAFERVFISLDTKPSTLDDLVKKDIWIVITDQQFSSSPRGSRSDVSRGIPKALFLYTEREGVLKKQRVFYFPEFTFTLTQEEKPDMSSNLLDSPDYLEYIKSYYREIVSPATVLVNFEIPREERELLEQFLQTWHAKDNPVTIVYPETGHNAGLIRIGMIQAEQELEKQGSLSRALKQLLKLPREPHTIDCFDISHKQGMFMVGSCVRFTDGQPDKNMFRRFHIKTVVGQDDYASLQEIVSRRYIKTRDFPDLILIDGGKGQLSAASKVFPDAEIASLAKREETVYSCHLPNGKKIDVKDNAGQILIALRDYAHHFAISFHRKISKIE